MENPEIGSVESVNLRDIWRDEALHFTPWLAENLHLLGKELHMELELVKPEKAVGAFSLDILARETGRDVKVAIEKPVGVD